MKHNDIAQCNECFLVHEKILKIYASELEQWDEIIEMKKEECNFWVGLTGSKKSDYLSLIRISEDRIKELTEILKMMKTKKLK